MQDTTNQNPKPIQTNKQTKAKSKKTNSIIHTLMISKCELKDYYKTTIKQLQNPCAKQNNLQEFKHLNRQQKHTKKKEKVN